MKIKVYERVYEVLASFSGESRDTDANAYLEHHRDAGVIAEREGVVYVVKLDDKGTLASASPFCATL